MLESNRRYFNRDGQRFCYLDFGGDGLPHAVFLHGTGMHAWTWRAIAEALKGQFHCYALDQRGHGDSTKETGDYRWPRMAEDLVAFLKELKIEKPLCVGHSMGGAVALALASGWFGVKPSRVFGIGIKVAWSGEELLRLGEMAAAPVRWFASKDEAVARYLIVSGLAGLAAAESPMAMAGVVQGEGGWRLAADPRTALVGAPPMPALIAAAQAPFHLARGQNDKMMTREQLSAYDPDATDFPALGHNAMIESGDSVWRWIEGRLT